MIYLSEARLEKVKALIEKKDDFFTAAYKQLIIETNEELSKTANPVTNKTKAPPSGDKHDYMSIAPYRWPNPETADGFPWIVKDGEINRMTRGDDTDKVRLSGMFGALNKLSMAYYFSGDIKYSDKAKPIIKIAGVDFSKGAKLFEARIATPNQGISIEIRLDNETGELIGDCLLKSTGSYD